LNPTQATTDGAGLRFARDGCRVDMRVSSRHRHEAGVQSLQFGN